MKYRAWFRRMERLLPPVPPKLITVHWITGPEPADADRAPSPPNSKDASPSAEPQAKQPPAQRPIQPSPQKASSRRKN